MKIRKVILLFIAGIALAVGSSFNLRGLPEQEYVLKAAFLFRFTDYIEWPDNSASDNFVIGVLKESPITGPLTEIFKDKKIKNKTVIIKTYKDETEIGNCQLLFISRNYTGDIATLVSEMKDKPMLTVAEQKGACAQGAHINFFVDQNKLKFEINLRAASQAGFKISSQLLQHAALIINN